MVLSIVVAFCLAFIILISGLQGGADAKALFCTILASPLPFSISQTPYNEIIPFSMTLFMNSLLLLVPFPFFLFLYNVFYYREMNHEVNGSPWNFFIVRFLGYQSMIEKIKRSHPWHYDFLEEYVDDNWIFKFRITLGDPVNDLKRREDTLEKAERTDRTYLWVQPSIPFIIPLLIAFYFSFFFGNLYFFLLEHFFSF